MTKAVRRLGLNECPNCGKGLIYIKRETSCNYLTSDGKAGMPVSKEFDEILDDFLYCPNCNNEYEIKKDGGIISRKELLTTKIKNPFYEE